MSKNEPWSERILARGSVPIVFAAGLAIKVPGATYLIGLKDIATGHHSTSASREMYLDYLARAACASASAPTSPGDAIYPVAYMDADGQPFSGDHRYVWHLERDELPPVRCAEAGGARRHVGAACGARG